MSVNPLIALSGTSLNTAPAVRGLTNTLQNKRSLDQQADRDAVQKETADQNKLNADDERRRVSLIRDSVAFQAAHKAGDTDLMRQIVSDRKIRVDEDIKLGLVPDSIESDELVDLAEAGEFDEINRRANIHINAARTLGEIPNVPESSQSELIQGEQAEALGFPKGTVLQRTTENGVATGFTVLNKSDVKSDARQEQDEDARAAGASNISVSAKAEGAGQETFAKEFNKVLVKEFEEVRQKSVEALAQNSTLDNIGAIKVSQGLGVRTRSAFARGLNLLGVNGNSLMNIDPANVQAFNSQTTKLVLDVKSTQKGPQTDLDQDLIAATVPQIENEEIANGFIRNAMKAYNFRWIEKEKFYTKWLDNHKDTKGALSAWVEFKHNTPMLSDSLTDENGLPQFFHDFKDKILEKNPGLSDEQVIKTWRELTNGQ